MQFYTVRSKLLDDCGVEAGPLIAQRKNPTRSPLESIYLLINQRRRWLGHNPRRYGPESRPQLRPSPVRIRDSAADDLGPYGPGMPYRAEIAIQLNLTIGLRRWHK